MSHRIERIVDGVSRKRIPLLASAAALVWLLGAWGFSHYQNLTQGDPLNNLYQSFQLFWSGFWQAPEAIAVPWQLETARWAAPLLTATALISAFGSLVKHAMRGAERRAAAGLQGHTVVIGLGAKGRATAMSLVASGSVVVVVEQDEDSLSSHEIRAMGAPVIVGDGSSHDALLSAGVPRAGQVLVVCNSDVANIRIALSVKSVAEQTRPFDLPPIVIAAHVSDMRIARPVLESCNRDAERCRIECVNARLSGIARLLNANPLPSPNTETVVVLGTGPICAEFIAQAAGRARLGQVTTTPLEVVIVGEDASNFRNELLLRFPGIDQQLDLSARDVRNSRGLQADWSGGLREALSSIHGDARLYVLLEDDADAVRSALLSASVFPQDTEISLALEEPEAYCAVLGQRFRTHDLFGVLLDPEIAFGGTTELLAQAIHELYVAANAPRGTGSHLAEIEWEAMADSQKAANRSPAADIPRKLAHVGCEAVPISEWRSENVVFSMAERSELALLEHERWREFTTGRGYTWGPERNDETLTHPDLVEWDELTASAKQKDFDSIDSIPLLLGMIGYRIERLIPPGRAAGAGDAEGHKDE